MNSTALMMHERPLLAHKHWQNEVKSPGFTESKKKRVIDERDSNGSNCNSKRCRGFPGIEKDKENQGRWTQQEHNLFVEGLNRFGKDWEKVQSVVRTRTLSQIRSHAQKYFLKLTKFEEMEKLFDNDNPIIVSGYVDQLNQIATEEMLLVELMQYFLEELKRKRDNIIDHVREEESYDDAEDSENDESSEHVKQDEYQPVEANAKTAQINLIFSCIDFPRKSMVLETEPDTDRECGSSICTSQSITCAPLDDDISQCSC